VGEKVKRVRLYALSTCATCAKAKKFLSERKIDFEVIDVDRLESGEQWVVSKEVKRYNPSATYPTLVVEEVITEYDEEALKRALDIP
jgi:glutaredoxin